MRRARGSGAGSVGLLGAGVSSEDVFVHTGCAQRTSQRLCNTPFAFPEQSKHCRELIAQVITQNATSLSSSLPPEGRGCPSAGQGLEQGRAPGGSSCDDAVVVLLWCLVRILDNLLS